jgi:hypothetical protein
MPTYIDFVNSLSPVGYWPLVGGSGTAQVGTDLTMTSSPPSGSGFSSVLGNSTDFDGSADFGSCAHQSDMEFLNVSPWSFMAWLNPDTTSGDGHIAFQRNNSTGGWNVTREGTSLRLTRDGGGSENEQSFTSVFAASTWVFVVAAYDGAATWRVYVNGAKHATEQTSTLNIGDNSESFFVATGGLGAGDSSFDGRIQHLALFAKELQLPQIVALYNAGTYLLDLEGYRWRDDNGSESGASWLDSQDTNITRAKETNTRLRLLTDTTGDAPTQRLKLQYRKVGTLGWRDIS